uniref:Uncharacterized protein n=1 Tax=Rhodosorus marinus TaxID=101924 RepID=A0A7S0G2A9_9RHOD|mmetsp:Transcript_22344/g.32251  ORF Transcript_22344/g.32251 Transcript_22344/m.32251 type:complete len:237 (+) Transcript_22344:148-858(+)
MYPDKALFLGRFFRRGRCSAVDPGFRRFCSAIDFDSVPGSGRAIPKERRSRVEPLRTELPISGNGDVDRDPVMMSLVDSLKSIELEDEAGPLAPSVKKPSFGSLLNHLQQNAMKRATTKQKKTRVERWNTTSPFSNEWLSRNKPRVSHLNLINDLHSSLMAKGLLPQLERKEIAGKFNTWRVELRIGEITVKSLYLTSRARAREDAARMLHPKLQRIAQKKRIVRFKPGQPSQPDE